jgi:2-keto-3-deoxy-L-rhamnonate aldolase RhmA
MKAAKILREKVDAGEITTGVLATDLLFVEMVEYAQLTGIDYLIADQEHGVHSDDLVARVCALGRMVDFPVLIRPIDTAYATIRQAIDRGPCGFLLPGIESAADLDRVRDSIYLPPRGNRRPGGPGNYWVSDYTHDAWKNEVEDDFIVLPQIETRKGLGNAEEIAGHEITTAIAIGPYDLSADMGVCSEMDHPEMRGAVEIIRQAGEKAGKTMWRIGDGEALAKEGFHFLCIGEPMRMLQNEMARANSAAKDAQS